MEEIDLKNIRASFQVAKRAQINGNHPFGAILGDEEGNILLEAENTVVTDKDVTGHAEVNLIRMASRKYDPDFLKKCTLYASTEPCPMCAGAIFWGNIRRVVFGISAESFYKIVGRDTKEVLNLPSREFFSKGQKSIEVIGPLLEEEARNVHMDFWNQ